MNISRKQREQLIRDLLGDFGFDAIPVSTHRHGKVSIRTLRHRAHKHGPVISINPVTGERTVLKEVS